MTEADDGRHDVPPKATGGRVDVSKLFMPQAKKPETEKPWHGVGVPTAEERAARETERQNERKCDVRAKALDLAVQCGDLNPDLFDPPRVRLLDLADDFVRYIETGERPA